MLKGISVEMKEAKNYLVGKKNVEAEVNNGKIP